MTVKMIAECIFEGSKFFWRTRNNIDINIIAHTSTNTSSDVCVYEVVLYEPAIDTEASRTYIDGKVLISMLNNEEIEEQVSFAKRNNIPITNQFLVGLQNKSIIEFIKSRINIDKFIQEENIIEASVHFSETDLAAGILDNVVVEKHEGLQPFVGKHHKLLMADVVQDVMKAMQDDKKALHESCETASELVELVDHPLSVRERWRIPLVISKLARRKQLNAGDAKIYQKFQANMKVAADGGGEGLLTLVSSRRSSAADSLKSVASPRSVISRISRVSSEEHGVFTRTTSKLYDDTVNSRRRHTGSTEEVSIPKHHKSKTKRRSLPRRKRSTRTARTRGSVTARRSSTESGGSSAQNTARDGVAFAATESDHDSDESENEDEQDISFHVQRLVAGLKSLGSTIKSSFLFSRPVVVSTGCVIEPILEQDEHNKSIKQHVATEKLKCDSTNAIVVTNTPSSSSSTTPSTTSTTPTSPINMLHTKNTSTSYVTPIMHSNGKDSVSEQMSSPITTPLPTMLLCPLLLLVLRNTLH